MYKGVQKLCVLVPPEVSRENPGGNVQKVKPLIPLPAPIPTDLAHACINRFRPGPRIPIMPFNSHSVYIHEFRSVGVDTIVALVHTLVHRCYTSTMHASYTSAVASLSSNSLIRQGTTLESEVLNQHAASSHSLVLGLSCVPKLELLLLGTPPF